MKYRKEIVKANVDYRLPNGNIVRYSEDDLQQISKNTKSLISKGYRVPAPWEHNRDITLSSTFSLKKGKITQGSNGLLDDPLKNAGYWEDFSVENGSLVGVLDVGNPDIEKKIGNEIRDVSLYVRDKYKDPLGYEHGKVLMHVCLTGQPVAIGTSNFEKQEVCLSQAMLSASSDGIQDSILEGDDAPNTELGELIKELKRVGLLIPETTSLETLVNNLLVAAMNYQEPQAQTPNPPVVPGKSPKDEERDLEEPPEGSKKKADKSVGGVIMSQDVSALQAEIDQLKKDRDSAKAAQEVLMSQVAQSKLGVLEGRVAAIVAAKGLSQEEADKLFKDLLSEKSESGSVMLSQQTELQVERLLTLAEVMVKNIGAHGKTPQEILLSQFAPTGSLGVPQPQANADEVQKQLDEFRAMAKK